MDTAAQARSDTPIDPELAESTAAVRSFNRFYTRQLDLLAEGLLGSGFSLTEARILYELGEPAESTGARICADLGLDPGYLSRILKRFDADGLLVRSPSTRDARQTILGLTDKGHEIARQLNAASDAQVGAILARLTVRERRLLVAALGTVLGFLAAPGDSRQSPGPEQGHEA